MQQQQNECGRSETEQCCICLESLLTLGMGRQTLPCGHIMHEQCITAMRRIGASGNCPMCRAPHEDLAPVQLLLDKAVLLKMRGEAEETFEVYNKILEVDYGNAWANFFMGEEAHTRGDYIAALEFLEQADRSGSPEKVPHEIAYNIGVLHEKLGNTDRAVPFYEEASRNGNPSAMFNLGILLSKRGEVSRAMHMYEQARLAGHLAATFNLGNHYRDQGSLEKAMLTFEEAYRNGHPNAANSLASLYSARGNFSRAIQLWEERCRQGCAHSAQNLGNCHMQRGNFDQATACFKTLQLQGNINGTFGLADTHAAQGNYRMARQLFEECLKRGHPQASRALAQLDLLASDRAVPHEKSFAAGDQVWIKGLQSDAGQALNGCRGIVEKYHVDAHRFAVQIEGKGTKLFKPVNLQGCQGDAPESVRGPQVGDAVKIHGLKTTCKGQALNGCEGVVVGCDMRCGALHTF